LPESLFCHPVNQILPQSTFLILPFFLFFAFSALHILITFYCIINKE
jgi:hypothetical protein